MQRLAVVFLTAVVWLLVPIAPGSAAPLPGGWCGADEFAGDRPDVMAQNQVHVVYAYPSDAADRFADESQAIVRDLAGVDTWWRSQDPTRAPRFDFADFPGCGSEFGALDLSSLALTRDSASMDIDDGGRFAYAMGNELTTVGHADTAKKYLVYYDGPAPDGLCGRSASSPDRGGPFFLSFVFLQGAAGCALGGYGTGDGWPARTAAHELIHLLNDFLTEGGAPNACDDGAHVCDSTADVLSTGSFHPSPRLRDSILDVGNDDYYNHPGTWFDVRDSAWLMHLELPSGVLAVTATGAGGRIFIAPAGHECTGSCTQRYDGGTAVQLRAEVQPGYRLLMWSGACTGMGEFCDATVTESGARITAAFGSAVKVHARAIGPGGLAWSGGEFCGGKCSWDLVPGSLVRVVAQPGAGARFAGWRGLCAGSQRTCTVAVSLGADRPVVSAVFRAEAADSPRSDRGRREP